MFAVITDSSTVPDLVEHLYRRVAGQLAARLIRIFGTGHFDLAESVVHDAFLKAIETWPVTGVPNNPVGWLTAVSRNRALDVVRRDRMLREKEPEVLDLYERGSAPASVDQIVEDPTVIDDQLRLMFVCCHPSLSRRSQVALTLKVVAGFTVPEISRAFLSGESATRKLITRAKQTLSDLEIPFEWPLPEELPARLGSVLDVLYLIFNEGYSASDGDRLIREELCDEAIWLTSLFLHESFAHLPERPTIHAVLALMLLQSSRFPARVDENGELVLLQDQDRALWDKGRISLGMHHLKQSATGTVVTPFHLEAEISACHAVAPRFESADWGRIAHLYDQLLELTPNPVVALNRAVAIGMDRGPSAALECLQPLVGEASLERYHPFYVAMADAFWRIGDPAKAKVHYQKALELAPSEIERRFLTSRIKDCA